MGSPTYHPIPRESSDLSHIAPRESSELDPSDYATRGSQPRTRRISINYVILLRLLNISFALPAFILFITHRGSNRHSSWNQKKLIATYVFLMLSIVYNFTQCVRSVLPFTVEVKVNGGPWQSPERSLVPRWFRVNVVDAVFASGLLGSLIGGLVNNFGPTGATIPAIILSFFAMILQYIIALPTKQQNFLFTIRFHKKRGEGLLDNFDNYRVVAAIDNDEQRVVAPTGNDNVHRQTAESLV